MAQDLSLEALPREQWLFTLHGNVLAIGGHLNRQHNSIHWTGFRLEPLDDVNDGLTLSDLESITVNPIA